MAELVSRSPTVPKVRGLNPAPTHDFYVRARLFELMVDEKYQIKHLLHVGSILRFELTCLRSTYTIIRIKDRRQPLSWTSLLPSNAAW